MTNYHINITDKCNLNCKHCYAVKKNTDIDDATLDLAVEFLRNRIKLDKENGKESHINILGSEIGMVEPKKIRDIICRIKDGNDVEFETSSNLCYEITEERIEVYKLFKTFLASFDYDIRFANAKNKKLWFKNINLLVSKGINVSVTFTITKQLVENVTPESFIDFCMALPVNTFCFQILSVPVKGKNENFKECLPINAKVDNWLFDLYRLYENYRDVIKIRYFEEARGRFKGIPCGQFGHNCMRNTITISTDGKVSTCPMASSKPFYDLKTKQIDEEAFNYWLNWEQDIKEECKKCEVFEYCKGSCFLEVWDDTGCTGPKKMFMYMKLKHEAGKLFEE